MLMPWTPLHVGFCLPSYLLTYAQIRQSRTAILAIPGLLKQKIHFRACVLNLLILSNST